MTGAGNSSPRTDLQRILALNLLFWTLLLLVPAGCQVEGSGALVKDLMRDEDRRIDEVLKDVRDLRDRVTQLEVRQEENSRRLDAIDKHLENTDENVHQLELRPWRRSATASR